MSLISNIKEKDIIVNVANETFQFLYLTDGICSSTPLNLSKPCEWTYSPVIKNMAELSHVTSEGRSW